MAVAYLDSDCDLAKGPADIMRALLAGQGGRLEEPIELSGDDDGGVEEDDDDVELLPSPPRRSRMVEVVDLLSSDDETDVEVMGYPSAAPNVVANGDSWTGQFNGCECCRNPLCFPCLFSFRFSPRRRLHGFQTTLQTTDMFSSARARRWRNATS
jgi:hypothetical protein